MPSIACTYSLTHTQMARQREGRKGGREGGIN